MYQDTYIEYWGEIFVSARIIEFGITFERFLKDPWKHLICLLYTSDAADE